jgi:hypothetical protein
MVSTQERTVFIMSIQDKDIIVIGKLAGNIAPVSCLFDLNDGCHLITGDEMGEIVVWDFI